MLCPHPCCDVHTVTASVARLQRSSQPRVFTVPLHRWHPGSERWSQTHGRAGVGGPGQEALRPSQLGGWGPGCPSLALPKWGSVRCRIARAWLQIHSGGTSLAVQWLGLRASTAGGTGSIPGQGTKIPHAVWCSQKKKHRILEMHRWLPFRSSGPHVCRDILRARGPLECPKEPTGRIMNLNVDPPGGPRVLSEPPWVSSTVGAFGGCRQGCLGGECPSRPGRGANGSSVKDELPVNLFYR